MRFTSITMFVFASTVSELSKTKLSSKKKWVIWAKNAARFFDIFILLPADCLLLWRRSFSENKVNLKPSSVAHIIQPLIHLQEQQHQALFDPALQRLSPFQDPPYNFHIPVTPQTSPLALICQVSYGVNRDLALLCDLSSAGQAVLERLGLTPAVDIACASWIRLWRKGISRLSLPRVSSTPEDDSWGVTLRSLRSCTGAFQWVIYSHDSRDNLHLCHLGSGWFESLLADSKGIILACQESALTSFFSFWLCKQP